MRAIDWSGMRFGKLTGVSRVPTAGRHPKWLWRCDCGADRIVATDKVRAGRVISCGCATVSPKRHGHTYGADGQPTRTYRAWVNMRGRVRGASKSAKKNYRDRGITVCPEWANSFERFLADMGECPDGMSLDREDNDGNYEPGNCRWATPIQQSGNTRRTRRVLVDGAEMSLAAACRAKGILYDTAMKRITKGRSPQEALDRG